MLPEMPNRLFLVIAALVMALLACSIDLGGDDEADDPDADTPATPPTVTIISPQNMAQFPVNQRIDIVVETSADATLLQLLNPDPIGTLSISGANVSEAGTKTATLNWKPERQGTYQLQVIASTGELSSDPIPLTLIIGDSSVVPGSGSTVVPGGDPASTTTCVGTVVIASLNFRSEPNTDNDPLGKFAQNEVVTITGRTVSGDWYQVRRPNGDTGWGASSRSGNVYIQADATCIANLPPVDVG
ncbi:MAG: SH3 domain-containing protein [Chloroflexi bacterium]|nr:SH3 domain-containing protein [Chloroflexota bacterium]